MSDLINIGIQSLAANRYALTIASQNIANANTPYYSRRIVEFAESAINKGVNIADVRRIVDEAANTNAQVAKTNFSQMDTYLQNLNELEPLFDDRATSVAKYITDSVGAIEKLNANAASPDGRRLYMTSLATIANQAQAINGQLSQQWQTVNSTMQTSIGEINNLLTDIASINGQLLNVPNHESESLLDKRNGSVQELAKYLNFTTMVDSNGIMSVNLSNGMPLVTRTQPTLLGTMTDPANPANIKVTVQGSTNPIDQFIQSGQLAGLINFRNTALVPAQLGIGRLALAFAQTFNAQNQLGMDANGKLGGNIFNDINSSVAINNRVIPNSNNTGSANLTVNIDDVTQLQLSNYQLTMGAANAYVLTRQTDGKVMSSGTLSSTLPQTISADGYSLTINSGTLNAGDQYGVTPTQSAADNFSLSTTDPTKLALSWPVMGTVGAQASCSSGAIKIVNVNDTTNAAFSIPNQLNPPLKIQFITDTTFNLINATTSAVIESNISYVPGASIFPTPGNYDPGYQVQLSNTITPGDTFNIGYNSNTNGNENGLAMAALYQQGILQNGSLTFGQAYDSVGTSVSLLTNQIHSNYEATRVVSEQAEKKNDNISGVSLEEETMNLARYQEAYQASAQILETAKSVLQSVIEIARR